jgi:carbamoyl-phosphate synthase large subunit
VAKATGVPLVKVAARVMVGATLAELRAEGLLRPPSAAGHIAVKEAVLPFNRFPEVDTLLGPEMRSTGEVMGIDRTFGLAFGKAQVAAGDRLPEAGMVFLSLADRDKPTGLRAAIRFVQLGFEIAATAGTAGHLERHQVPVAQRVAKLAADGQRDTAGLPTAVDLIAEGKVQVVVNSPRGRGARADGAYIRRAANAHRVPCLTTAAAAAAAAESILDRTQHSPRVRTLQEYQSDGPTGPGPGPFGSPDGGDGSSGDAGGPTGGSAGGDGSDGPPGPGPFGSPDGGDGSSGRAGGATGGSAGGDGSAGSSGGAGGAGDGTAPVAPA